MVFRVTRDGDTEISDDADDLLEAVESELRKRRFGAVVRLEVSSSISRAMLSRLDDATRDLVRRCVSDQGLARPGRPRSAVLLARPAGSEVRAVGAPTRSGGSSARRTTTCSRRSRNAIIIVQHPYDSFTTSVEALVKGAARDESVVAIKTTVYRTTQDSALANALVEAAENGKQMRVRRRAQGTLRRATQHRMGAITRASGCPRGLRVPGHEDPREDDVDRPARGRRATSLRPHRDRQLSRDDGPYLRGHRPLHSRPGDHGRRRRPVQLRHRVRPSAAIQEALGRTVQSARRA